MAEWSKAPDSRFYLTFMIGSVYREFWSSYEGVGSNPTSDSNFFVAWIFQLQSAVIIKKVIWTG